MVLDPDDGARSKRRARRQRRQQSTATTGGTSPSAGATPASVVAQAGTEQTLQQAAAAYAKLEQSQKLLQLYEEADEAEEALPVVIRALLRMRRVELALELYVKHVGERPQAEVDTRSTCSLFLALCRTRRLEDATELLSSLELAHPPPDDADARAAGAQAAAAAVAANAAASAPARLDAPPPAQLPSGEPLWHAIGALLRPSLALARLENGDVAGALELTERLGVPDGIAMPPVHTMTKLVRAFGKARCLPGVYACLDAQALARQEADAEGLQVLVDALVRDTRFVKGGVSMSTLPEEDYPEVAFVGRSNVGKSSMVNMVLGAPADPRQRRNGVWRQRRVAPTAYGANGVWRQRRVAPTANGVVPPTRLALADLLPPLEEAHHPRRLPDFPHARHAYDPPPRSLSCVSCARIHLAPAHAGPVLQVGARSLTRRRRRGRRSSTTTFALTTAGATVSGGRAVAGAVVASHVAFPKVAATTEVVVPLETRRRMTRTARREASVATTAGRPARSILWTCQAWATPRSRAQRAVVGSTFWASTPPSARSCACWCI